MPQTTIGRGNLLYDYIIGPTLTPASVAATTSAEQQFAIPGIQNNMTLDINFNGVQTAGIGIVNVRVVSTGAIGITFQNSATSGALTPASGQYLINIGQLEVSSLGQLPTTAG